MATETRSLLDIGHGPRDIIPFEDSEMDGVATLVSEELGVAMVVDCNGLDGVAAVVSEELGVALVVDCNGLDAAFTVELDVVVTVAFGTLGVAFTVLLGGPDVAMVVTFVRLKILSFPDEDEVTEIGQPPVEEEPKPILKRQGYMQLVTNLKLSSCRYRSNLKPPMSS